MAKKDKKSPVSSGESEVARKFKQNPGLYIGSVLILIIITVAFVGGDLITRRSADWDFTFGYYDKIPIKWAPDNTFDQFRRNAIRHYQSQGYDMSNQWIMVQIWQQAYEAAVVHTALLQVMQKSNYSVPVKTVDKRVAGLPDFQENGTFSAVLYNRLSESEKLSVWRQTQEEIIKGVFFSDFFDGLMMTTAEAEFIGNMASPERAFDMVSFNVDDYPESEFLSYAKDNARLFASIHLSRITITSSEREAKKIHSSINSGTITFEDAARTQSQDSFADRGGDMGSRQIFDLEKEITSSESRDFIFSLHRGEISPVINLGETWAIFRVEDELKEADFEDELVMERVRSYLRNSDRGRMEDWALEQANNFIADVNSSNFDSAASARSLEVKNFGPFALNFGGVELFSGIQSNPIPGFSDQEITDISRNENFWKIAFSTKINTPSEPFVQGNNVLVLLPTEEIDVTESKARDSASSYLSYWLNMITEQSIQHYFLHSPKMDDRFMDTYFREMM